MLQTNWGNISTDALALFEIAELNNLVENVLKNFNAR